MSRFHFIGLVQMLETQTSKWLENCHQCVYHIWMDGLLLRVSQCYLWEFPKVFLKLQKEHACKLSSTLCTVASENSLKNTKVAIIYLIVIPDMYWVHQGSKFVVANTSNGSKCYHVFSFATGMLM